MTLCRLKKTFSAKRLRWILSLMTIISVIPISSVFASEIENIKDIDITLAVDRQLQIDEGVPAHLIDVHTKDGIVTLSGPVENLLARERAAEIAETVKGV
ncbi:MAG: BON domain-containing protein, partial [Desulfobacterales bacterium]